MSLSAPSINTTISTTGSEYIAEVNDNFSDIQDFMDATEAEFNAEQSATQGYPFTFYHAGALTEGAMNAGIIVPFAGEVILAYGRLNSCLTDTDAQLSIEFRDGSTNVFGTDTMDWEGGDGNTVQLVNLSGNPLTEVSAGTFIQVFTVFDTYDWTAASGLAVTMLIRRKQTT